MENKIIAISNNIQNIFNDFKLKLSTIAENFQDKDSGWVLQRILFLDVNVNKYNPVFGKSQTKLP